jgi:hypothetical protein
MMTLGLFLSRDSNSRATATWRLSRRLVNPLERRRRATLQYLYLDMHTAPAERFMWDFYVMHLWLYYSPSHVIHVIHVWLYYCPSPILKGYFTSPFLTTASFSSQAGQDSSCRWQVGWKVVEGEKKRGEYLSFNIETDYRLHCFVSTNIKKIVKN